MRNIDVELLRGGDVPLSAADLEAIQRVAMIVDRNRDHVLIRFRFKVLRGLIRKTFSVRLGMFSGFLSWLLEHTTALQVRDGQILVEGEPLSPDSPAAIPSEERDAALE